MSTCESTLEGHDRDQGCFEKSMNEDLNFEIKIPDFDHSCSVPLHLFRFPGCQDYRIRDTLEHRVSPESSRTLGSGERPASRSHFDNDTGLVPQTSERVPTHRCHAS